MPGLFCTSLLTANAPLLAGSLKPEGGCPSVFNSLLQGDQHLTSPRGVPTAWTASGSCSLGEGEGRSDQGRGSFVPGQCPPAPDRRPQASVLPYCKVKAGLQTLPLGGFVGQFHSIK